jgi:hypothetical protein
VTLDEPEEQAAAISLALEGLEEGPASQRAIAPTPRARADRMRGAGLWATIRSGLRHWDRATGRDGDTDEVKRLRKGTFFLIYGGLMVGLFFPNTNLRVRALKDLPIEAHRWAGLALVVWGVGMFLVYASRYPMRALRSFLEMAVIIAAITAIAFLIIKPWIMDKSP